MLFYESLLDCKVKDYRSRNYKKYTDLVPDIIKKYNGKILARGGKFEILEGSQEFHRLLL